MTPRQNKPTSLNTKTDLPMYLNMQKPDSPTMKIKETYRDQ
uniref:Uncharacterized protein n=1 Tax=Rhizophora mucronata TaxID=61149 RepID=A0A2P2NMN3_RHIMU